MKVFAAFIIYSDPDSWLETGLIGVGATELAARKLCADDSGSHTVSVWDESSNMIVERPPLTATMPELNPCESALQAKGLHAGDYVVIELPVME
jgi:hypothetical protein